MKKPSSASARIFAVTALVIAFIVAAIAIGGALGGDDSGDPGKQGQAANQSHQAKQREHVPATYEVKSGDTLISIAHRMGITVAQIEQLNPEVDPQILIAGETLKLQK